MKYLETKTLPELVREHFELCVTFFLSYTVNNIAWVMLQSETDERPIKLPSTTKCWQPLSKIYPELYSKQETVVAQLYQFIYW